MAVMNPSSWAIAVLLKRCRAAVLFCIAGAAIYVSASEGTNAGTNAASSSMILDLGTVSHHVKVTPEYTQAVLTAVLPYFSEVAKKLDLPVPQPITQADVAGFHVLPFEELTASMLLKNKWVFNFGFGYVRDFSSPNSYYNLQNPDEIPKYYGQVKVDRNEAIKLARVH